MEERPRIEGVGVLYFPVVDLPNSGTQIREVARKVAESIRLGSVIGLPSTRDENGHLVWDFRIEAGDPGQVEVRRVDADEPYIIQ